MPLNTSGQISLAGSTTGQSIAVELGLSPTGQISLNDTNVRTLAGVPSGQIIMPTNFYGKSNAVPTGIFFAATLSGCTFVGTTTRVNVCGALIGSETNVGTGRFYTGAAPLSNNGLFFGGSASTVVTNTVTRINASGALVGSETTAGGVKYRVAGAKAGTSGTLGIFYGGATTTSNAAVNTMGRINGCGAAVGGSTSAGTARYCLGGAHVGSNGMFYGGERGIFNSSNAATRINACGAIVGTETTLGQVRSGLAGAPVGSNGMFFGGQNLFTQYNIVTRINACGALVGSQTNVGTARWRLGGAGVSTIGIFYGGATSGCANQNLVTRINACGALVGSQTNVGTARSQLSGAGV